MIARIKRFFQSSRRRAQILAEARELMAQMDGEHWAQESKKPLWELQEQLMNIGLAHIRIATAGQEMGQKMTEQIKEARWAPIKEAHRN